MRKLSIAIAATLLALAPVVGSAAPALPAAGPAGRQAVIPAQGWWEHEGRYEELRERYWRLPPRERAHYDDIQFQIDRLERRQHREFREGDRPEAREIAERIEHLRREQFRILRYGG